MQPLASRQLECNILSVHTHVAKVGRTWWSQNDNDVTVDGHVPSETRDGMRSWWMLLPLACRRDSLHSLRGQQGGELSPAKVAVSSHRGPDSGQRLSRKKPQQPLHFFSTRPPSKHAVVRRTVPCHRLSEELRT